MSGIVKAQLLRHLSKFVKNLSADHLSLKLLQGAGDIENIELNEILLSSTLGLPPWLRLTRAHCNRMSIRLHWTRLTSEPISIALDVVYVDIEATEPSSQSINSQEKKEQTSNSAVLNSFKMPYGFINKAVDGISLAINTIKVQFKAGTFLASLELSHVVLQSCLPDWSRDIKHLKNTRIKNTVVKQVLLFKLAHCNTMRLETTEIQPEITGSRKPKLTPFRVIVNKLIVKIQLKRSLSDSSVLFTKLSVEIDDILSVLTDAQAQVGLRFINYLQRLSAGSSVEIAAKRAALARTLAAGITQPDLSPTTHASSKTSPTSTDAVTSSQAYHKAHAYFINHDFAEHSTHVKLARIDLHLVAERASSCSDKKILKQLDPILLEGAVRISLENLCFNLYPAHILGAQYKGWPRYQQLFRNARNNLEEFQGCFEAIGYGSIDAVKLYAANLPHEHNPNQLCISICGARKWPAVYFDSSQIVSEKDLSIVDSRNAIRISRVNVDFHLPTLLYLIVMVQDARELFKISDDLDIGSTANRCTKVELVELDLVYQPQVPKQAQTSSGEAGKTTRPVILLSVSNALGQLVERPVDAVTTPAFSDSVEVAENELYSFIHSFLVDSKQQPSSNGEEFELKCAECCSEIESSRRHLWHWQFSSIFARTVTATDGDIPLLYIPKIVGFMPHNLSSNKMHALLKCEPIEGPIQLFAERAQFDELQEMLQVFQNFAAKIQKSMQIFGNLVELKLIDSVSDQPLPPQVSQIVFLAPLISIRLLLPAVPPLIVPLTASSSTQTGESAHISVQEYVSSSRSHQVLDASLQHNHPLLLSRQEVQSSVGVSTFSSTTFETEDTALGSSADLFAKSGLGESPSRSILTETMSQMNASIDDNVSTSNIVSSSSSEDMVDFVVVKPDDQLDDENESNADVQTIANPLDPNAMNFGLQGGLQEVVSVQIVLEGLTCSVETSSSEAMPTIEARFDRLGPINKPRVITRRDVYFPLDIPVSMNDHAEKLKRRQFKITISELLKDDITRQVIDVWLAPNDSLPLVSMSAVNALAHFMSPDAPITDISGPPPIIRIHTASDSFFKLKMDTPNVFDHLPQDLIHYVPQTMEDDKRMSISVIGCPLLITQDSFHVTVTQSKDSVEDLLREIEALREENSRLKASVLRNDH